MRASNESAIRSARRLAAAASVAGRCALAPMASVTLITSAAEQQREADLIPKSCAKVMRPLRRRSVEPADEFRSSRGAAREASVVVAHGTPSPTHTHDA